MQKTGKSGQIILIVLLTSIILLTVGLAITSQTITDLNISTQEQQYTRSFNAAEAGIEDLIGRDRGLAEIAETYDCPPSAPCNSDDVNDDPDLQYKFTLDETSGGTGGFNVPSPIKNGDVFQLKFDNVPHPMLAIYWQDDTAGEDPAAIELIYFYQGTGDVTMFKRIIASDDVSCDFENHDDSTSPSNPNPFPPPTGPQKNYLQYYIEEDSSVLSDTLKYVRIKPLCAATTSIALEPVGGDFRAQYYTAHVESASSGNVAAMEVQQSAEKSLPGIFDYALFSGSDIRM